MGREDEALLEFREAARLKPEYSWAYSGQGVILADVKRDYAGAEAMFREVLRLAPDDANAHGNLGDALVHRGKVSEGVAELREAIRLAPDFALAHGNLGLFLVRQGKLSEGIAELREAIRLRPDRSGFHGNLGQALIEQGKWSESVAESREALRLKPDDRNKPLIYVNLGSALAQQGKLSEAVTELREAVRLAPNYAEAHDNLGAALAEQGKLPEAIAELSEVIRIRPDIAIAHNNLGSVLGDLGRLREAIAELREAIRLQPDLAEAHYGLGKLLMQQNHFREALDEACKGHELGSKRPNWRFPSEGLVRSLERLVALEARLPAVQRGEDRPADGADGLALADVAYRLGRTGLASRLYAETFRADPKLAADGSGHRYNAACCAALAGCGQSHDDPVPDAAARAGLRLRALGWLRGDLAAVGRALDAPEPKARADVVKLLRHWKKDGDLAGVRDPDALATLPEAERADWRAFWAEVDRHLKRADAG